MVEIISTVNVNGSELLLTHYDDNIYALLRLDHSLYGLVSEDTKELLLDTCKKKESNIKEIDDEDTSYSVVINNYNKATNSKVSIEPEDVFSKSKLNRLKNISKYLLSDTPEILLSKKANVLINTFFLARSLAIENDSTDLLDTQLEIFNEQLGIDLERIFVKSACKKNNINEEHARLLFNKILDDGLKPPTDVQSICIDALL